MIRIARLEKTEHQAQLIDQLLSGAAQKDIREEIDRLKGKPPQSTSTGIVPSPKPKRVYHTKHKATVIIQSETSHLTSDQVIEALQEALGHAVNHVLTS